MPVTERRLLLALLFGSMVGVGVWALLFPASFYADFPLDRAWVALDGPYNEHLLRDVGALNLALAVVLGWAFAEPSLGRVRIAAWATLVYAVPHVIYHVTHLEPFPPADAVAQSAALTLTVAAPVWLLWRGRQVSP